MTGNHLKAICTSLAMVGLLAAALPQQLEVAVSKNTVAEGEKFRIEYSINAAADQFTPPRFEGLRILSGPNQSTNMQFINGRSAYSVSYSYVLMALKEGDYTIGKAGIRVGSAIVESGEVIIKVVKGNAPQQSQAPQQQQRTPEAEGQPGGEEISNSIFITASVSNSRPFVGEVITATYKLYFNMNIADNTFSTLPSLNGFWSEDLNVQNSPGEIEVVNGVRYNVAVLKKAVLIPHRSGELILDPLEMDLVVQQPVQSRSRNLFDQFFGNFRNVKLSVKSKPVKVKVKALPDGRPPDFNGAVGQFSVKLKADRTAVKTNEAVNITYEISGSGNLKVLDEKKLEFPADFEVYDPKVADKISVTAAGISGSRSYNYLAIPRVKGEFSIGPVAFSYFDPSKEKYVSLTTALLSFEVEKGPDEGPVSAAFSAASKEDIKVLGNDIRFIRTNTVLLPAGYDFFGSLWFYVLWLLPIPLFIAVRQARLAVLSRLGDQEAMRWSKANKMAARRLSAAKSMIGKDDKKFYEEIYKALYGFLSDKFNLSTSELEKEGIKERLLRAGISEELVSKTDEQLSLCEMARFAPVKSVSQEGTYNDAISLLSSLQKSIKKS